MEAMFKELIVTAASESYKSQLLALIGSLNCNWPDHPAIFVYDIGLEPSTLDILGAAQIHVEKVPAFCPHWRKHYTWKLWCWNHAPAERVFWLDAGCCVLRPMPEVFEIIDQLGYFAIPNYYLLEREASEEACEGCRVSAEFRKGKGTVASGIFGFRRGTAGERVVQEALQIGLTEKYIMAYTPSHRWEQALLSLLLYKQINPLILCDGTVYGYGDLRAAFSTHAIWAARRSMHPKDRRYFASSLAGKAQPHLPRSSHKRALWYRVAWFFYRCFLILTGHAGKICPSDGVRVGLKPDALLLQQQREKHAPNR